MKKLALLLALLSVNAMALDESKYFQRPLSCPLRFSSLSNFRDQVQSLVASLGKGCTQAGQAALSQINSNVTNLEGVATSFSTYSDSTDVTSSAQYAKNVSQILNNINTITANNSCFYDIKSRGTLPVLADVILSASQFGLLVPSVTGAVVATGGIIAGSAIKIIHELVKKKFNFNKPEERRAFLQLNCAFFENRRVMEESGIFNPETESFRDEIVASLRRERIDLLKAKKDQENDQLELINLLSEAINTIPSAKDRNLNPVLDRTFQEVMANLGNRPADYTIKLRQVSYLTERMDILINGVENLKLDPKLESTRLLLFATLAKLRPDLEANGKAWTNNIDEYEMFHRGPLMAFLVPVADALKKELMTVEAELAIIDPAMAKNISQLRLQIKEAENSAWAVAMRLTSLESKISSLEKPQVGLFSDADEGTSNEVEILDYYRKLQNSILGREGKDYIKNVLKVGKNMKEGLETQVELLDDAKTPKEKCSAAEKTRFAWAQYRYKIQEAHDFVATNLDLYRSNFRIGNERLKSSTTFVLKQIESVEAFLDGKAPAKDSVGLLMKDVSGKMTSVETKIQDSGCF